MRRQKFRCSVFFSSEATGLTDVRTEITAIDGNRVQVRRLEALDGTPIIDVKPIHSGESDER